MHLRDLLDLLRFRFKMIRLALTMMPMAGAAPDGEGDGEGDGSGDGDGEGDAAKTDDAEGDGDAKGGDGDGDADGDSDGDGDAEPQGGKKDADYYRRQLRRVERQATAGSKKDKAEIADLKKKLKAREDADKSEQEKAVEAAKEEGANAARTEAQRERRADRLALSVERLAAKGVKVGEGDEAETVKFRGKPALVLLEKSIESGDLDTSNLFDDKDKIRDEGLREAVATLLEDDDWLIDKPEPAATRRTTESDAGKGGTGSKSLEEMSPDDHLKAIQKR